MAKAAGYLSGIRVLDLSRVLAGPFCCQLLADLGADVVKVERPGAGDDTRQWGPPFLGEGGPSTYYLSCNRGKRSLALDLARPESRAVLNDLVRAADVLVENFRPASLAKLGLDAERVATLNPRLVRASISGFGRTGPLADVPGYDLTIQALAGLMSITGEPDGMPMKVGVAITDVVSGLYAAVSVLAGLVGRERSTSAVGRSGAPSHLSTGASPISQSPAFDLALADCSLAALVNVVEGVLVTGERPRRYGNAHPQIVPYEAFRTADGYLVLGIGNDGQWQRFCAAAGCADWARDTRFATNPARVANRGQLIPPLQGLLAARTTSDWLALCDIAEVPCAPVASLDEIVRSPQVAARGMVQTLIDSAGRSVPVVASPIHAEREPPACSPQAPPTLGEHSDEVLREWLEYDEQEIAELRRNGTIA